MFNDGDLMARTHLVAHALRELDSGLRSVLISMLDAEQRNSLSGPKAHKAQVEAACTLLGFREDDEIRTQWWAYASRLHEWTHRNALLAPRVADSDFEAWWDTGQAVLYRLARQFETIYGEALPRVDALAQKTAPTRDDLSALRNQIPHGVVALDRFFARATPAWFPLLHDAGYFRDPPSLQPDDDGQIAYVPWPPGQYLVRHAQAGSNQSEIIEIASALDTDNPAAQEAVVDIALAVSADTAVILVERIVAYLVTPYQWRLPFKARDLIVKLAQDDQTSEALALLRPQLAPSEQRGQMWRSTSLLDEIVPEMFPAAGLEGIGFLLEILGEQADTQHDYSYIWRPSLDVSRGRDMRDALVSATREAAKRVIGADREMLGPVIAVLDAQEGSIFVRLALDLLVAYPDEAMIAERLSDRDLFDDFRVGREYALLAHAAFADLPPDLRDRILRWIEAGPPPNDDDTPDRREHWQLRQLARLGDGLPDGWQARYDELVAKHGEPERIPQAFRTMTRVGTIAPLTKEDLASKSTDELLAYLESWTPAEGIDEPSAEGLADTLAAAALADPSRFSEVMPRLVNLRPGYARAVLGSLQKTVKDGGSFSWAPVLVFAQDAAARPRLPLSDGDDDHSRGWRDVRSELARLFETGMAKQVIPPDLAEDLWAVLVELSDDPEPDLSYETELSNDGLGPAGLALNTIRGLAIQAVMRYAWWRKQQAPSDQPPVLDDRVRDLLDRHLDPMVEPTKTVRSVYGLWFPTLVNCDPKWAATQVNAIFSTAGQHADLGQTAWDSYLVYSHVYNDVVPLLGDQYAAAVERTIAGVDGEEVREALVAHLLILYLRDLIQLDGRVLGRFLSDAPVTQRARLIETIGIDLSNGEEFSTDVLGRMEALWQDRIEHIVDGNLDVAELAAFGWWFASGALDNDWSFEQLVAVLELGATVEPQHLVIERLHSLLEAYPAQTVKCLAGLVEVTDDSSLVLSSTDEMRDILAGGLASDSPDVHRIARGAVNRLVARGNATFADML